MNNWFYVIVAIIMMAVIVVYVLTLGDPACSKEVVANGTYILEMCVRGS